MGKIMVTGASGFIGSALTSKLQAMGREVIPLGFVDGDIADRETLMKFIREDIAHVFHLAGRTYVPDSWKDPLTFCRTNVLGTVNALEFCRQKHIAMTYVSAYIYGHPDTLPICESNAIRPSNPYALSKWQAEESCEFYARTHGLPVTTIRPFNVYGIGQAKDFLIPVIISQALDVGKRIVVKDLAPKRDYVYLEDMVAALLVTLDKPNGYRVYNIGSGTSLSVREIIDIIQNVVGTRKEVISDNAVRTNELMDVVADISSAGNELGWHPETSFRAGIENIIRSEREKMR